MKILKLTALYALLVLCFIACHQNAKQDIAVADKQLLYAASQKEELEKPIASGVSADSTMFAGNDQKQEENKNKIPGTHVSKNDPAAKPDWDKKIVKTANLDLEVKDYNVFNNTLHKNLQQFGAYIAQEEQNQSEYKIENTIVIKVPVEQFDAAVAQLTSGNEKLVEKKIISEDVTGEMIDTKSRMEAKKQVRLRYLDLLKQARNMEEILQVQNEINNIQEEIESASGRIGYLSHSSAFSTVNITFYQVLDINALNINEPSFLHKIREAFAQGTGLTGNILIGIISLWPVCLVMLIGWGFYRKWRISKIKTVKL
jgi:uncharacterized protein DUF4349